MNGNGDTLHHRSPLHTTTLLNPKTKNINHNNNNKNNRYSIPDSSSNTINTTSPCNGKMLGRRGSQWLSFRDAAFMKWTAADLSGVFKYHRIPCFFFASLLFFMSVEYTLRMLPPSSPPFDIGFVATAHLHRILASSPALNTLLAGLNTVFVGMQSVYIIGAFLMEGRPRPGIAALFMFTCRGILGYSTQLPLPEEFLGSGVDFPVGNVSFFLFYSGHVAGSVIASLDMRRMQRLELARLFDALNLLQMVRLLSTRGHYTIDLVVGVGAGMLFDSLAGKYLEGNKKKIADINDMKTNGDCKTFFTSSKLANGTPH